MKTDKLGIELHVGDSVFYTKGQRGDYKFYTGVLVSLRDDGYCMIKTNDSKRQISRQYNCIVNIEPFKITNPEVFI